METTYNKRKKKLNTEKNSQERLVLQKKDKNVASSNAENRIGLDCAKGS